MQKTRKTLPLSHTVIGELYKSLDTKALSELDHYIEKMYATKRNNLVRLHKELSEYTINGNLDSYSMKDLEMAFMQNKERNYTLFMTYVNRLQKILKEFIILSKIESKNIYTETLWGEYLIENNLKRNIIIHHANYRLDLHNEEYPLFKDYIHKREKFFLTFIQSARRNTDEIEANTLSLIQAFNNYSQNQQIDNYRTLSSFTKWFQREDTHNRRAMLSTIINANKYSSNPILAVNALQLAMMNDIDDSYIQLMDIFEHQSYKFSRNIQITISTALLNYLIRRHQNIDESLSILVYKTLEIAYSRNILFHTPTQAANLLETYMFFELKHGHPIHAREILAESIHQVSPVQRDSCEKLCLARIEFSEGNYAQALHYIDQGNTANSLYYYPLFKVNLLKILVLINDELRFRTERENLYKYLHQNKKIDSSIRERLLIYYRYIDLVRRSRWQALSDYRRKKLKEALLPSAPFFYEKIWMRERVRQLEGEG